MSLSEEASVEVPSEWVVGSCAAAATAIGASARVAWGYWSKKDSLRDQRVQELLNEKDVRIGELEGRVEAVVREIAEVRRDHAEKVSQLSLLSLQKVEEWSAKNAALLDRALGVMAAFTVEVREFRTAISAALPQAPRQQG